MVVQAEFEGKESFRCEACGFHFKKKDLAEKCEKFCREKNMCNSEITAKALERNRS